MVELLVVIGIIALLIGILLPALGKARDNAKRVACAAKLHAMMQAASIFVGEHKGYYPLVGQLNSTTGIVQPTNDNPSDLNDTYSSHYAWMGYSPDSTGNGNSDAIVALAPITFALGTEMGFTKNLTLNTDPIQLQADMDNLGVIKNFLCPAQASTVTELPQLCWLYANTLGGGYTEQLSYVFNEYVLGYDDNYGRLRGQASQIRQPALTMFAMDGLGGSTKSRLSGAAKNFGGEPPGTPPPPWPTLSIWNNQPQVGKSSSYNGPITLGNALTKYKPSGSGTFLAGDPDSFDQIRHKGKINVAFFDGHVESLSIPSFTESAVTSQVTFKNDPGNTNLANDGGDLEKVFLKAP